MSLILFSPELSIRFSAIQSVALKHHYINEEGEVVPPHLLINDIHTVENEEGFNFLGQLHGCGFYSKEQDRVAKEFYQKCMSKYENLFDDNTDIDSSDSYLDSHPLLNKCSTFFSQEQFAVDVAPQSVHFERIIENSVVINDEHTNTNIGWRFWIYENEAKLYITGTRFDLWDATDTKDGHWRDLDIYEDQLIEKYQDISHSALASLQSYVKILKKELGRDIKLSKESAFAFPSLKSILRYDENN